MTVTEATTKPATKLTGDVNGDRTVNIFDLVIAAGSFGKTGAVLMGDVNGDGIWNILDLVMLVNCVLATNCEDLRYGCAGDLNRDGGWNVLDVVTLANCILSGTCSG